nr:ribonuclease H-like domain-containing protein [Tanacetum cinerariifolium]
LASVAICTNKGVISREFNNLNIKYEWDTLRSCVVLFGFESISVVEMRDFVAEDYSFITSGFSMTDIGLVNCNLGISVTCDSSGMFLSQQAEYHGVSNVVAKTCWLRNLLCDLLTHLSSATLVYCDTVNVVNLSSNSVQHQRTKHIEIDIHFVQDLFAAGQVRILHVPSCYQYADIFTKGLPLTLFEEFRTSLSV